MNKRLIILLIILVSCISSINAKNEFPVWVHQDAIEAAYVLWKQKINDMSDEWIYDLYGLKSKDDALEVHFKFPFRMGKIDYAEYDGSANIIDHLVITKGFGFSIYWNENYIGCIEVILLDNNWEIMKMSSGGKLLDMDEDDIRNIYNKYPLSEEYQIIGIPDDYFVIENDKVIAFYGRDKVMYEYSGKSMYDYFKMKKAKYEETMSNPEVLKSMKKIEENYKHLNIKMPIWEKWKIVIEKEKSAKKDNN